MGNHTQVFLNQAPGSGAKESCLSKRNSLNTQNCKLYQHENSALGRHRGKYLPGKVLDLKCNVLGLPWWLSDKEPSCQCRRHGFDPWSGKIPHVTEQLSPSATTIEPVLKSPGAATTEAHAP